MRPRRYEHMEFKNIYSKKFSGKVTHVHKTNNRIIWIKLDDTMQLMKIDMDKIGEWKYSDKGKTYVVVQQEVMFYQ